MNRLKKYILIAILAVLLIPAPRARAFDPITLAVLAPLAVQLANSAKPYLFRGATNLLTGVYRVGKDVVQMAVYFPIGLGEVTVGAPFGRFHRGCVHLVKGGVAAPCRLVVHSLLLPLYACGIKFNTATLE